MIKDYDYLFKIVIVGNTSVGKSALLRRFADDTFQESYLPTIGVDFRFKTINVDGNIVKLQIWDTAGQQLFRTITSTYYRGAQAIVMIYDLTNQKSYDDIKDYWMKEIEKYGQSNAKSVLIGNKVDCKNNGVNKQDVMSYANGKNIPTYQVSAKTGEGIDKVFFDLAKKLIKIHPKVDPLIVKNSIIEDIRKRKVQLGISSGTESSKKKKGEGCC